VEGSDHCEDILGIYVIDTGWKCVDWMHLA